MVAALSLGAFALPGSSYAKTVDFGQSQVQKGNESHSTGGPVDLAIANQDKLIEMLKKSGAIPQNATAAEAENAVNQFLKTKAKQAETGVPDDGQLIKEQEKLQENIKDKMKHQKGGHDKGSHHKDAVDNVVPEKYNGTERKDKVLVLLIEYPDFPHNQIKPGDTDMYYSDYTQQHYQDMIFGDHGYKGPDGKNKISVKQYYEQQSGGSYTIDGQVAGWYMAKQPAAYYGGNGSNGSDANARGLIKEALDAAAKDPNVNLADYDQEDRYDLDGDGNYNEPDGLVDHLMVVHSSVGEEAGGGKLGEDAIWSHRWNLGAPYEIPNTSTDVPYWGGSMGAYDYTIEPADGAAGVFAHEYGHDLGLPDEYDTQYSGAGEAVSYWSIMASGSWSGAVPGTEPSGFSAWSKEFLQAAHGGNWLKDAEIDLADIDKKGVEALLDQASTKGTNLDALKINLPKKETVVNTPYSGSSEYFSGSGNNLENSMSFNVDLTKAANASLNFKTWYDIEQDWDYASIKVREAGTNDDWTTVPGNLTTTADPNGQNPGDGITGKSDGWVDGSFDLSAYAGKNMEVKFNYWTDVAAAMPGFYVDDIQVTVDGETVLTDNADGDQAVTLDGFEKNNGKMYTDHYYLLEWRNHQGVDEGLAHLKRGNSMMEYDPGLVVWYVDDKYDDNWTGIHPGEGFLGVVDADQHELKWSDNTMASTRYQIHDAAFSLDRTDKMFLDYTDLLGLTLKDYDTHPTPMFDDRHNYLDSKVPDAGRDVPKYGLKIRVTGESKDRSVGRIEISK
ncbi:M6 family metalloprotease domain-containing protein [Falsibacillus albus]|uniref:M6 family metalloprotease domain-containing protein n=2 Tax=Falsibacillus albus TaxID=2478915 RepID=A0A3L7K5F1_9BACI|nr:immune inhibitor A domain-containing protein [Falsibacillus albus]RLQ98303.1 M6 family metalloprotease domain-containing protein [Falsibacillus albus]